jgi:exo-beta-1,3-glucanase (GH17 family)
MRRNRLWLLAALLLGWSLTGTFAQDECQVSDLQKHYFAKIGIGANYGPHYPCYNQSGQRVQCIAPSGGMPSGVAQDAKNAAFQTSVPLDMSQLQTAGFQSVRAYGDPPITWITIINQVAALNRANPDHPMGVVYQVSGCGSDVTKLGHPCEGTGTPFQKVIDTQKENLKQVIDAVRADTFQSVVKLVIVTNEDLVAAPDGTLNTEDIISALDQSKQALQDDGIKLTTDSKEGVDVSTDVVIGQMLTLAGMELAAHFTPHAPVMENIYGFQFGDDPAPAVERLRDEVAKLQKQYPDRPAMVGETGWATEGADSRYPDAKPGLPNAIDYFKGVYPYARACSVPTLAFESYDQPTKSGKYLGDVHELAEQHYGLLLFDNTVKDMALRPGPTPEFKNYDTSQGSIFIFNGGLVDNQPAPATITIEFTKIDGSSEKATFKPVHLNDAAGHLVLFWPALTLYGPTPLHSQVTLYHSDGAKACSNTVEQVNTAPLFENGAPTRGAFAGGNWQINGPNVPDCPSVNWKGGTSNISANVFLPTDF